MKLIKITVSVALVFLAGIQILFAQGTARIKVRFHNMDRDKVYFDFMEQPSESRSIPYRKGQEVDFDVNLEGITMMKINTFVLVVVQPGDQLDIDLDYIGRNYKNARFSGTSASSVAASRTLNEIRAARLSRNYKTNIPAALAIQTPADVFFKTSVEEWKTELHMLDAVKNELTPEVYRFVRAEIDGIFIPNITTYPNSEKQEGYWNALDSYRIQDDSVSLSNFNYLGALQSYLTYSVQKNARDKGREYIAPKNLKERYGEIVEFYKGDIRDAALLVFLYTALSSGRDFEVVESLYKDYQEKYNKNPKYTKMLSEIMK